MPPSPPVVLFSALLVLSVPAAEAAEPAGASAELEEVLARHYSASCARVAWAVGVALRTGGRVSSLRLPSARFARA